MVVREVQHVEPPTSPMTSTVEDNVHITNKSNPRDDFHIDLPPQTMATEITLAALATLPTPLLVLSSSKTIILANNAIGKLLGLDQPDSQSTVTDLLRNQTLSQIGIDMVTDGAPVWVNWDKFLDNVVSGFKHTPEDDTASGDLLPDVGSGETTPTAPQEQSRGRSSNRSRTFKTHDTVVDIVFSSRGTPTLTRSHPHGQPKTRNHQSRTPCRMIISIWFLNSERFFTLTFTSASNTGRSSHHGHLSHTTSSQRTTSSHSTRSSHSSHSQTPGSSTSNSQANSPAEDVLGGTFLPAGTPASCFTPPTVSDFQKIIKMKNAMLNAIDIPLVTVWRDQSVVFPNQAARKLLAVEADPTSDISYDFRSRFNPWSTDFTRELSDEENPIIALCHSQKPFSSWKVGLINDKTAKRSTFDVSGHPVFDETSRDFLGGLMVFRDVTEYAEKIASQSAENDERFRLICDTMPQMLWTTTPEGYHDYFSQRWYDYTGLTPGDSLGMGWKLPFHEQDMPETGRRWQHSLATGDEYKTQYRCRRYDGEWRWMLGRALPLKDHRTGKILKWYGSCTDIQDIIDAKLAGHEARRNLLDVLRHSQMSLWSINQDKQVTFFEGDFLDSENKPAEIIGASIYDLWAEFLDHHTLIEFQKATQSILSGESDLEVFENKVNDRWFRSKLVPLKGKRGANGVEDDNVITGVIGIGTEVTGLRRREQENIKLLANETAAKAASKMKSNFLANMSHEIRTPIAGVLGMSELLMDTALDTEQSEFAQNIQRSANSLLTVINDILDFSKIESGRLDIEEVQFSLSVLLEDVNKMLSFAAQRKGLEFCTDFHLGSSEDVVLLGDPGRLRQILTNLLTNSIKFTSDGFVKMSTRVLSDSNDTTVIEFTIEDTGIGIEEEVKKRLFKPFSQADSSTARRFGGSGLGLTICKNLVDLMHGSIRLESRLDAGTQAIFHIPFKKLEYRTGSNAALLEVGTMPDRLQSELSLSIEGSGEEKRKHPRQSQPVRISDYQQSKSPPDQTAEQQIDRADYHILVVEDNPVNQQIAIKFIKALKFRVSAVWNGREALEYLLKATSTELTEEQAQKYPLPSLILMDVQMPVLDGYHATHMLRHHAPFMDIKAIDQIPIVAMTASAIQGDREKCERAGMDDYMAKPVKRSTLEETIVKWVTRGRSLKKVNSPKPHFDRSETDRSSTCTQHEAIIAAEFLGRITPAANAGTIMGPPQDATHTVSNALARRSSASKSLMAAQLIGGANEGERSMDRAEAEDKARSLRDAKLYQATEDNLTGRPSITLGDPQSPLALQVTPQQETGLSPSALTVENVTYFNLVRDADNTDKGYLAKPLSPSIGSIQGVNALSDIPGPPPAGLLAGLDIAGVESKAEAIVQAALNDAQYSANSEVLRLMPEQQPSTNNRRVVGGLIVNDSKVSDWSTSTARPGN